MTYLENWGSGIRKIADSCREAGLEEPTYSDEKGFVSVCFKRPSYRGDQTSTQTVPKQYPNSTQTTIEAILEMIKNNPEITREQLATALSKSPDTIKKHIAKLKKTGKIVRIGPQTYGGRWEVIE